jgi:hypothetical protein
VASLIRCDRFDPPRSNEKEAEADLRAGRHETFDTMEEFLASLD